MGRIADRGPEHVSPKEWIRICFDLLDLLKAHKKGIRRATINTVSINYYLVWIYCKSNRSIRCIKHIIK